MHDSTSTTTSAPVRARRSPPACTTTTTDFWFAERPADVETAKALCRPCPMREACLAGAIRRGEAAGVWGGQLFVDGVVVAYKRGRGRPRKDARSWAVPIAAG